MVRYWLSLGLLNVALFATATRAQILGGDTRFNVINQLQWKMTAPDVRGICASHAPMLAGTDSTISFKIVAFGTTARAQIQFVGESQRMLAIRLAFEESAKGIRDSLINHFTTATGRKPLVTTREKSFVIFTLKIETASWIKGKDGIHLITMSRGDEMLGVTLVLSPVEKVTKPN